MSSTAFHGHPGDAIADPYNIPGIVLFLGGVVALASTITAAGDGAHGWTAAGAAATVALFGAAIAVFLVEHRRLRRAASRSEDAG